MQYKWKVLTVTTLGVFMSGVDARIVIIGLPQVAAALGADAEQAIWFTQAYVFGSTVTLLFIGRVTDMIGRTKIYNAGFAIFTVGSLFTSLSVSPYQVIAFRGIQGLGAAMLLTNGTALVVDVAERKNLGLMLSTNQLAFRGGTLVALTLSGIILSLLDWRGLFYINIPIGIFGTYWAHRQLKETLKERSPPSNFDWTGFITFTVAIAGLLLGLTYSAYESTNPTTVGTLFLVSATSFGIFVRQERRAAHPMLDLKLIRMTQFTGSSLSSTLNAISWGASLLLLSLYFQLVRGLSPLQAGILLLPLELAYLASGAPSGKLSDKFGRYPFIIAGLILQAVGVFSFSSFTVSVPLQNVIAYAMLFGVGAGLYTAPNSSLAMEVVPAERRGIASATNSLFWNVGITLSLNLVIVIMTTIVPYHIISSVIASPSLPSTAASGAAIDRSLFLEGLRRVYSVLVVINLAAIIPIAFAARRASRGRQGSSA